MKFYLTTNFTEYNLTYCKTPILIFSTAGYLLFHFISMKFKVLSLTT